MRPDGVEADVKRAIKSITTTAECLDLRVNFTRALICTCERV